METTYGERLRLARERKGLNQLQLAKKAGVSQSNLHDLEKTGQGSRFTVRFAQILDVRPQWLEFGEEPMEHNVSPSDAPGRVPLISSVAAGMFREAADLHPAGFADEWVPCSVPVKAHTFALKVEGDSMEPRFQQGMILIVEPDMQANPGDYVIVKNGDNEATFKQLVKDGPDLYLKPLNTRYPMKPLGNSIIIGVVRQVLENFR